MSDLSNRLALREEMQHEENVRLNRAHLLLQKRAPEAWEQFKATFYAECDEINNGVALTQVRCDEPDSRTLYILRERYPVQAIARHYFKFDARVPCISWQDLVNKRPDKIIEMALNGSTVLFVLGDRAIVLSRFVADCLESAYR